MNLPKREDAEKSCQTARFRETYMTEKNLCDVQTLPYFYLRLSDLRMKVAVFWF
jgi:hypothetical protein